VVRAVAPEMPPKWVRVLVPTSFSAFESRVPALLAESPETPATAIAERVGWDASISWWSRSNSVRMGGGLDDLLISGPESQIELNGVFGVSPPF
jgi:hypothetical protein